MKQLYKDKNWLEDRYLNRKLSCQEIAKPYNVSANTIYYWLEKHYIPIRTRNSGKKRMQFKITKRQLEDLYLNQKLSMCQIAKLYNTLHPIVLKWIRRFHIPIRLRSETNHIRRGSHCNLSDEAKQFIDGELLGDGCLRSTNSYSAGISYTSIGHCPVNCYKYKWGANLG